MLALTNTDQLIIMFLPSIVRHEYVNDIYLPDGILGLFGCADLGVRFTQRDEAREQCRAGFTYNRRSLLYIILILLNFSLI